MVKTAAAGIVEEWRRDDLGLGIGGGRRPQRRWLKVKMVSAAAKCWFVGFGGWWVDVADGSRWVFFFFFFGIVGVGSVIRGGHGWRSLAWVASLASLLAWG